MKMNATVFLGKVAEIAAGGFDIVPNPKQNPMTDESDNPLSDYLRRVMAENGLSSEAVSQAAERRNYQIARATVGQILNGKTPNPGIHTLEALAAGLNRPFEELLSKAIGRPIGESQLPADFAMLADLYRQLPLTEQRLVRRFYLQVLEREMRRILTQLPRRA